MQSRSGARGSTLGAPISRNSMQVTRPANRSYTSKTLQRAGSVLSAEQAGGSPTSSPFPALTASSSTSGPQLGGSSVDLSGTGSSVGTSGGEKPSTPPEDANGSAPCGLTPASLKHLRRQNGKLTEEKDRLQAELESAQVTIRELRDRIAMLEEQLRDGLAREESLQQELAEAREREEAERKRAEEVERLNVKLEESLAAKEAEVARLRQALEEQLQLTKEVCEAADRHAAQNLGEASENARLNAEVARLQQERDALEQDRQRQNREYAELQQRTAAAMAAAEKAMALHAQHVQRVEHLHAAKLADAIQHKVELHISVPRVTLSYNNAPPLLVSVASGLSDDHIKGFLDSEVFPHFEPLWITLDAMDKAPDGTSKKAYSTRMLERLTEAVKGFVERSQKSDTEGGLTPSVREPLSHDGASASATGGHGGISGSGGEAQSRPAVQHGGIGRGTGRHASRSGDASQLGAAAGGEEASLARRSSGDTASLAAHGDQRSGQGTGGGCAIQSLADVDRERLLCLLRSGDDRGLDSKLKEILQSRA